MKTRNGSPSLLHHTVPLFRRLLTPRSVSTISDVVPAPLVATTMTLYPFKAAEISLESVDHGGTSIRTVPQVLQYNSQANPDHPFCFQLRKPKETATSESDLFAITHLQLRQAVSRCSAWLLARITEIILPKKDLENQMIKGPPVALLMESDIGILFHLFSLMSLGVPVRTNPFPAFSTIF